MDIYLKQREKITKENDLNITVSDLCEVISEDDKIKDLVVYKLNKSEYNSYVVTSIDITKKILEYNKEISVSLMGMTETIVEYSKPKKKNKVLEKIKVLFVSLIIFAGASTTIMSFHNETMIPEVFDQYHKMFFGELSKNYMLIELPYSIGLALGIIVFFNHIFGKKFNDAPTPIEIEMIKYESDLAKAEVKREEHNQKQNKGKDN